MEGWNATDADRFESWDSKIGLMDKMYRVERGVGSDPSLLFRASPIYKQDAYKQDETGWIYIGSTQAGGRPNVPGT